jgi:hypothetical protein
MQHRLPFLFHHPMSCLGSFGFVNYVLIEIRRDSIVQFHELFALQFRADLHMESVKESGFGILLSARWFCIIREPSMCSIQCPIKIGTNEKNPEFH